MNFNPDPTKPAQELIFSRKVQTTKHPPLFFNENVVPQTSLQKHLGMFLDSKPNFSEDLKTIFQKTNKTIGLLRKLQTLLPTAPFQQKMETIQYNAALAITGTIRGSYREKLHQELGLETLQQRRWHRKLRCFYKILKSQSPKYLYSIISIHNMSSRTRQCNEIPIINMKHVFFKNIYFRSTIIEWNKLHWKIKNSCRNKTLKQNNSIIHWVAHSISITLKG